MTVGAPSGASIGAVTDVGGLAVGHWTAATAATGCTVVTFPPGTVASGEVRGGAPATREFELLEPGRTVPGLDALVLTGGSAFGLAAADGVVRRCEERGQGFATPAGPVPIVVALALYDLGVGDESVRATADAAYAAALAAEGAAGPVEARGAGGAAGAGPAGGEVVAGVGPGAASARLGAGAGARVAKAVPGVEPRPGGLVTASARVGELVVGALVAVNASGVPGGDSSLAVTAPVLAPRPGWGAAPPGTNTTIGLVATNARLDKAACHRLAQGAHDGLARAVFPPHMRFDGDAFVAAALGAAAGMPGPPPEADVDAVRALAVHVVEVAILTLA
jgi:L-aminopeptidase/D-esterase-like protein